MKRMKKIVSIMLAMVMVLGLGITAFAAENDKSITIKSSPTVDVTDGRTFTAYKILDATAARNADGTYTIGSVAYTVPSEMIPFYNNRYFKDTPNADQTVDNYAYQVAEKIRAEEDLYAFAEAALGYANGTLDENGQKLETPVDERVTGVPGAISGSDYVISGLSVGYYVIGDSKTGNAASQVMLGTTIDNLEITVKADVPTIDKSINGNKDKDPGTNSPVDANNVAVGDKVPYTLTSKVPAMAGYKFYRFVISDTLSEGLTLDVKQVTDSATNETTDDLNGSFTIKIGTLVTAKDENGKTVHDENGKTVYVFDADGNYTFEETPLPLDGISKTEAATHDGPAYYVNKTDNADGTTSIEIVFVNFIDLKDQQGKDIVVEYSATLNEKAVIGTLGNPNTAKLDYSNDPSHEGEGDPENPNPYEFTTDEPHGTTEDKTVKTFVTALELVKVNDAGQTLAGAQFTIEGDRLNKVFTSGMEFVVDADGTYWGYNGTYTTQNPSKYEEELAALKALAEADRPTNYDASVQRLEDILARYETEKDNEGNPIKDAQGKPIYVKYSKNVIDPTDGSNWEIVGEDHVSETLTVDENGELVFRGLAAGTYKITEIKAPNGYNLLTVPIGVKIDVTYAVGTNGTPVATWSAEYAEMETDDDGNYTMPKKTDTSNPYKSITFNDKKGMLVELQIVNNTGTLLPSTGGIGTTIFYVAGSILVLAAVVLLVTKKRMTKEK